MEKKILIIVPTYNERENIEKLLPKLFSLEIEGLNILVVDDNSPDKTGDYVEEQTTLDERIHLIRRAGKMGLGTAYCAGFKYAIEHGYDFVFEMDADFSHDPDKVPEFLKKIEDADLVIGSRYLTGVNVINWPMKRLLLSYFANWYTRFITGLPIKDATGGYKCFRIEVLKAINLDKIKSNGYAFQIEMNFKAWKKGFKLDEIPIIFFDRFQGTSKMSKKIVYEAVFMVWKLRFGSMFGRL
ncbi:MAG: polyprenol monophosphomannose synthase [Ignavibacteriales bacterium]|nr:MAG: polyprenol monophosphomannose synthase [Ignavibacteriaceae bacterium]MBW7873942.1 polyprenol monophosphomannose synthase [Ignavibacteria bacterium]MCZ2143299.1 polyprenol monophosphomannose synthase [Ignavibacteriales bacterium]OQY76331.1 MAG: dolichyl-phosphate beta-D-mannosyltransferase [Ignavibacteriales bacterium UTCHB3]MBV6444181.1 Undecaprenyl-phosphate mannosyltransferase [Ignavibacteriaceae bacterium]